MMIMPIWFSNGEGKKHHVHGNGCVDYIHNGGESIDSGDGGSSNDNDIAIYTSNQVKTADHSHA